MTILKTTLSLNTDKNQVLKNYQQKVIDKIEKYLTREDGVQTAKVDYKKKTCKVTYLWDRTTTENIKTAIANIGYDAGDVAADPEAYKKLPTCCKKPADGGGH